MQKQHSAPDLDKQSRYEFYVPLIASLEKIDEKLKSKPSKDVISKSMTEMREDGEQAAEQLPPDFEIDHNFDDEELLAELDFEQDDGANFEDGEFLGVPEFALAAHGTQHDGDEAVAMEIHARKRPKKEKLAMPQIRSRAEREAYIKWIRQVYEFDEDQAMASQHALKLPA